MGSNLYVAVSGAIARARELDVVANNLANVDTTGFKRDRATFETALQSSLQGVDGRPIAGDPGRAFVRTNGVTVDPSAGAVAMTGGALDAAIEGPGFFAVETPAGTRYTRAGAFVANSAHQLSTPDGYPVLGSGGPIALGDRSVRIRADGDVVADDGISVGKLRIVKFAQGAPLEKEGRNLFRAPAGAAPEDVTDPRLVEGAVERANVEPVSELASMVVLHRAFDVAMQVLQADDQATQKLIREVS